MNDSNNLNKDKFIEMLVSFSGISKEELLQKGVLETGDLSETFEEIDRRSVSRILHNFMRIVLGIKDESDISKAYVLKDLFDCRVCANHIAQVYLKGVMKEDNIDGLIIFDVYGKVTENDVEVWLEAVREIKDV